jgi:hypothetical protein
MDKGVSGSSPAPSIAAPGNILLDFFVPEAYAAPPPCSDVVRIQAVCIAINGGGILQFEFLLLVSLIR